MKALIAYHGEPATKHLYVQRMIAHRDADQLVQGRGWENGKGCHIGCTLHNYDHRQYERELGVPIILARLFDRTFERLPKKEAGEFSINVLKAIPAGADLSLVWYQFAHWLLIDPAEGVIRFAKTAQTKSAIETVAGLYARAARGEAVKPDEWYSARRIAAAYAAAADAYADAAYAAAAYAAADAAAAAAAYAAADDAAYAAADDAAYAAAAYAAADDAARRAARDKARAKAYERQAGKLLELLAEAPVVAKAA